ncbi:MAG: hypothetical protein PW788_15480 [Micavibrio sp.]|nr:hypothetical protein [Micavibrio sp.]
MRKPKYKAEWAVVLIAGVLAAEIALRGAAAIVTQNFQGTARLSGPYELQGRAAMLMGAGYVLVALLIASGIALQLKAPRRNCLLAGGLAVAAALGCFAAALTQR